MQQKVSDAEAAGKDPLAAGAYYRQDLSEASGYAKKYSLSARIALAKTGAGTRGEADNEIRGIAGVTTVSVEPGSIKVDDWNYYSNINIKFQLLGNSSSSTYKNEVLIPALKKIKGIKVLRIGNLKEL
jgi:hypothetical protein